jgi:hypothetical protein
VMPRRAAGLPVTSALPARLAKGRRCRALLAGSYLRLPARLTGFVKAPPPTGGGASFRLRPFRSRSPDARRRALRDGKRPGGQPSTAWCSTLTRYVQSIRDQTDRGGSCSVSRRSRLSCSFVGRITTCDVTHTNTVTASATDDDGKFYDPTTTPPFPGDSATVDVHVTIP